MPKDLELGPVTILAGPNSSGKTTLLQSILFIMQTLSNPVTARPLVLNAEVVKLGIWSDVPHFETSNENISFEYTFTFPKDQKEQNDYSTDIFSTTPFMFRQNIANNIRSVSFKAEFGNTKTKRNQEPQPLIKDINITTEWLSYSEEGDEVIDKSHISVIRRKKSRTRKNIDELRPLLPTGIELDSINYKIAIVQTIEDLEEEASQFRSRAESTTTVGIVFSHFLPSRLVQKYDVAIRELYDYINNIVHRRRPKEIKERYILGLTEYLEGRMLKGAKQIPITFAKNINNIMNIFGVRDKFKGSSMRDFSEYLGNLSLRLPPTSRREITMILTYILRSLLADEERRTAIELNAIPDSCRAGISVIQDFFTNKVRYLGPLRDDPKVIYALPPTPDVPDVGIKGQHTAVVLDRNKEVNIEYIDPFTNEVQNGNLLSAVISWLRFMDILDSVFTEEAGKLGYKLGVRMPGLNRELDLTTVGVGVSQVLPILVMALLAPRNTLLIFEQPEIHLHPKVQSLLGDFFLSMGKLGKQCLVETHSEYLVNQLRRRIAESMDDEVFNLVKMYFVERIINESCFRDVKPNEYGAILDWPSGFFDESIDQTESILKSSIEKKQKKKAVNDSSSN